MGYRCAMTQGAYDVVIAGGGHNGLVAAAVLARAGLRVHVMEPRALGGAARTEAPFPMVPGLRTSTGAYLLGLMPPEIMAGLDLRIPTLRRDPHYFVPTTSDRYLLLGSDEAANRAQFLSFFSERDYRAHLELQRELAMLRDDIAPTWLSEPLSVEETAERYVRPALRTVFIDLCRGPICDYLARFGFASELIMAMYAVTDAFSGLTGSWTTPGTGMNFLVHNMCRLPGSDGTWMIVRGGMGAVSDELTRAALEAGATLEVGTGVRSILIEHGAAVGVSTDDERELRARAVIVNADPFRMLAMVGRDKLPASYCARVDGYSKPGTTMKVNLALRGLPRFSCLPEMRGQHHTTIHLLPEHDILQTLTSGFRDAMEGRLPERPTIEWYIHTTVDPSLADAAGNHNSALFVQWVPNEIEGSSWEDEEESYVAHLLSICDRFAPGTSDLVVDRFTLHPPAIERHFGMTRGHIHHVDNSVGFADRLPVATPIDGLYSASAGCHPAGSVIGAAGWIAGHRVIRDLGGTDMG